MDKTTPYIYIKINFWNTMNKLSDAIGKLCEVLLPIPEEFYIGNTNSSICVCTLSSIKLLKELKNSQIIENVAIAGRLFTENKGIDSIIWKK